MGAYLVFGHFITVGALIAVSMLSGHVLGVAGQVLMSVGRWQSCINRCNCSRPICARTTKPPRLCCSQAQATKAAWICSLRALSGVTLIVVSHSAAMLSVTQRLVVLENGRLLADGATDQMLKS